MRYVPFGHLNGCVCVCVHRFQEFSKGLGTPWWEDIMKCQRQELRAGPQGSGLSANGVATVLDSLLLCEGLRADSPGRECVPQPFLPKHRTLNFLPLSTSTQLRKWWCPGGWQSPFFGNKTGLGAARGTLASAEPSAHQAIGPREQCLSKDGPLGGYELIPWMEVLSLSFTGEWVTIPQTSIFLYS